MTSRTHLRLAEGGVDAGFAVAVTVLALSAFQGTFDRWTYLLVALAGAAAGVASVSLIRWLRWPHLVIAPVAIVLYAVLTPALALRGSPTGAWPTPAALRQVGRIVVGGWKDLLTTLPPVAAEGRLVGLVFLIGIVGALSGYLLARTTRHPHLPALGPLAAFAASAALGVTRPGGLIVRGVLLAFLVVIWAAVRQRRLIVAEGHLWRRLVAGMGVVAVAAGLATAASFALPSDPHRRVLRAVVEAPVETNAATSPLAAFRQLVPGSGRLADETLLTVQGLPAGQRLRLAVLDSYAGQVWAAGSGRPSAQPGASAGTAGEAPTQSGFLRVGSRFPGAAIRPTATATVTIAAAYANTPELRSWVPMPLAPRSLAFAGPTGWERNEQLRVNPATGAVLAIGGVRAGDSYVVEAVPTQPEAPTRIVPAGLPLVSDTNTTAAARFVEASTATAGDKLAQVRAVADRLRTIGAYTDGVGGEARFPAGHSVGRLSSFLADPEPAGNDEQYAAALALASNRIGVPARVVLLATPGTDGVVKGRDIRAGVEIETAPDQWWTIAPEEFVPDRNKHPKPRQDNEEDLTEAAVVPPPNTRRPPSSTEEFILDSSSSASSRTVIEGEGFVWPLWVVRTLQVASVPTGLLALWSAIVLSLKALRTRRRRTAADLALRADGAWRDVVDTMRDQRRPVGAGQTRVEQAFASGEPAALTIASWADQLTFGAPAPSADEVDQLWSRAAALRAQLGAGLPLLRRIRAALSPRSLVAAPVLIRESDQPSRRHDDQVRVVVAEPSEPMVAASAE